jgi:hypothetical protein
MTTPKIDNQPSLSDEILKASKRIINKWETGSDDFLSLAQQVNYAAFLLKIIGNEFEERYKANIRIIRRQ